MTLTQSLITRNTHAPLCVTCWQQQWPLSLESDGTVSTLASSGSVEAVFVLDSPRPLMTFFGFAEKDLSLWSGCFIGWLFFWLKIAGARLQSGRSSPPTAQTPKRHFSSCFESLEHFYLMVFESSSPVIIDWLLYNIIHIHSFNLAVKWTSTFSYYFDFGVYLHFGKRRLHNDNKIRKKIRIIIPLWQNELIWTKTNNYFLH